MKYRDPITGRWIKETTFFARVLQYDDVRESLADVVDAAAARYVDAPTPRSQRYWRKRLDSARDALGKASAVVRDMQDQLDAREALTRRKRQRRETQRRQREAAPVPMATEWEFGVQYESPRKGGHDVAINVRLIFDTPATERDARDAMRQVAAGERPDGVRLEGVQWTARGKAKEGTAADFENFRAIFYTNVGELRAGAVKEDRL